MHQEISTSLFFVSLKGLFSAFSSFHKGSNAIAERQLMIFLGAISYRTLLEATKNTNILLLRDLPWRKSEPSAKQPTDNKNV